MKKKYFITGGTGYVGADTERIDVNRIHVPTVYSVGLNIKF